MHPEAPRQHKKAGSRSAFQDKSGGAEGLRQKVSPFTTDYEPALQSTSVLRLKEQYGLFIGGKFTEPTDKKYFDTVNPATELPLARVALAGKKDCDLAVQAATRARERVWSKTAPAERGRYLFRIARILQERAREFSVLESMDGGKPVKESRDVDLPLAAAHFFYYAGWADKLSYLPSSYPLKGIGVCGQVIPWNFPLLMAAWKIAPALACGNTVVLKPAETTPLTALLLAEVLQEAGLPDGVVNILTGDGATGAALVSHPGINKIAFTGSTAVGKEIARIAGEGGKKLTLELGGKSANIVFADAALDQAVEGVVQGIYFNQGHVCCAGSRLLIEESVQNHFIEKLRDRINTLRVGNPLDKNTDIGAIHSKKQLDSIRKFIAVAKEEGGGFYQAPGKLPGKGYFQSPCFFTDQKPAGTLCRVEVFGPVLAVMSFRTPAEAIQKANDTPFGLAAGIWSEKASKIQKVASGLQAGIVWTNTYNRFDPAAPFGGFRESGWGREGGMHGLYPYLEADR